MEDHCGCRSKECPGIGKCRCAKCKREGIYTPKVEAPLPWIYQGSSLALVHHLGRKWEFKPDRQMDAPDYTFQNAIQSNDLNTEIDGVSVRVIRETGTALLIDRHRGNTFRFRGSQKDVQEIATYFNRIKKEFKSRK